MEKKKFAGIIINETLQNADGTTYAAEPLGLEYALAIAQNAGWEVKLFDNLQYKSIAEMVSAIKAFSPEIAGFSVFDNSRNNSLAVARELKQSGATILFGGYTSSACPELALRPEVDFVLAGEAEETLPLFLENYSSHENLVSIKNLARKSPEGQLLLERKVGRIKQVSGIRPLRSEFYLRQKEYCLTFPTASQQTGVAQITINRGCRQSCRFCSSSGVYGTQVTKRDVDDALDELEELVDNNVNLVIINDLNFTQDKGTVEQFCKGMRERGLEGKVFFEAFGNVSTTTPEMLRMLYTSGVRKMGYGIESLDPAVQRFIGKSIDKQKLKALLDESKELGILTSGFYQIGYPFETRESIEKYHASLIENRLFIPRVRLVIATPTSGSRWHVEMAQSMHGWPSEDTWPMLDTQHLTFPHQAFKPGELEVLRDELEQRYYESDFYRDELKEFVAKHPELEKSFTECGWKL